MRIYTEPAYAYLTFCTHRLPSLPRRLVLGLWFGRRRLTAWIRQNPDTKRPGWHPCITASTALLDDLGGRRNYPVGGLWRQWCRRGDFSGATHSSGDLRIGLGGSAGRRGHVCSQLRYDRAAIHDEGARGAGILGGLQAWVKYAGRTQRATVSTDPRFQVHSTRRWRMGLLVEGVQLHVGFGTDGLVGFGPHRLDGSTGFGGIVAAGRLGPGHGACFGAYGWDGPGGLARVWL